MWTERWIGCERLPPMLDPLLGVAMPAFSSPLARWFLDHHGIVSSSALVGLAVTDSQRRGLLADDILLPVHEGVYRLSAAPFTFEAHCAAACMADRSLVISCHSAGRLWGLRKCRQPTLHACTLRLTKPVGPDIVVHRTTALPDGDVVVRPDGIRLTSPPRTFFDLARHCADLRLESIGEQIIDRGMCGLRTLLVVSARLATPGRPGSTRAMRVLSSRPEFRASVDSHDELVLLRALHAVGLTEFVCQPAVKLRSGEVVHPDLGVPAVGFYVEVDHHTWHDTREAASYDKARDRQVRLTGAVVERVTDSHIRDQIAEVVAELVLLYEHRLTALGFGVEMSRDVS